MADGLRHKIERALKFWSDDDAAEMTTAVLPVFAAWLRDFADEIGRGPTFPLPPSVISALVRERADELAASFLDGGQTEAIDG